MKTRATMVLLKSDSHKLKQLITDAITVLCKSGLTYSTQLSLQGLLGITLDEEEILLIDINQTVMAENEASLGSTNTGTVVTTDGKYTHRRRPQRDISTKRKNTARILAKKRPAPVETHSATEVKVREGWM